MIRGLVEIAQMADRGPKREPSSKYKEKPDPKKGEFYKMLKQELNKIRNEVKTK